jgi:hypothetical protein
VTWSGRFAELCGSLALTTVFAAVATALATPLLAVPGRPTPPTDIGAFFFLTVGICWAVLLPAKVWAGRRGDSWLRRLIMMIIGVAVGVGALWLEGWRLDTLWQPEPYSASGASPVLGTLLPTGGVADIAAYLSYFGLVFFAVRWWRMAEPRRSQRFSFAPILVAGFWSLILLLIWPQPMRGAVALVMASAVIQLVSPWEQPPLAAAKRMRLRYA